MAQYVITLQNRASGENFTVKIKDMGGRSISAIHKEILKQYPGTFVKKSVRK